MDECKDNEDGGPQEAREDFLQNKMGGCVKVEGNYHDLELAFQAHKFKEIMYNGNHFTLY